MRAAIAVAALVLASCAAAKPVPRAPAGAEAPAKAQREEARDEERARQREQPPPAPPPPKPAERPPAVAPPSEAPPPTEAPPAPSAEAAAEPGVAPEVGREAPKEKPAPPQKAVEYERILGAFAIDPEVLIYFTPDLCERRHPNTTDAWIFSSLASRFEEAGAKRGEAAARLNHGALSWLDRDSDTAYHEVMRAQAIFAELGDVDGLAHAYEWLGYMFRQSGDPHRAATHLSVAYGMYALLENQPAQARVLAYAER